MAEAAALNQQVLDEIELIRIVDEMDNTVDEKDWPMCRRYFLDDIHADFTSLAGGSPGPMKADDFVQAWETNLYSEKKTHHMRSNHRVTINGDEAEVFSKGYALTYSRAAQAPTCGKSGATMSTRCGARRQAGRSLG